MSKTLPLRPQDARRPMHGNKTNVLRVPGGIVRELSPQELGWCGEEFACVYLEEQGFEIVTRNWTCPGGEADIVARDGCDLVLVEVKTRLQGRGRKRVVPELAVDAAKRRRYLNIATCAAVEFDVDCLRFDVVAVTFSDGGYIEFRHLVDAFGDEAA